LFEAELGLSDGRGAAVLAGRDSGQYVELPNGILSELRNATFEAWVTWDGQTVWERILDFGDTVIVASGLTEGWSYLFLTPRAVSSSGPLRVAHQRGATPEFTMDAAQALPANVRTHVALVVDSERHVLLLYVDGLLVATEASVDDEGSIFEVFSSVNVQSVWLGRSLYEQDAFFGGSFHEFRIYNAALSASEIQTSFVRGPDPEVPAN
jgi:hypothetical protein